LRRNEGIDLLRGGAIIFVVLNHVGMRFPIAGTVLSMMLPRWFLDGLLTNGYEAVFVFFVISGFLIAGNALLRWGELGQIDVAAFYGRRFARIVPCLLALVAILSVLHLSALGDYTINGKGQSLGGAIRAALALHMNWYEGRNGYLPGSWDVLWSLSIEEVFYLAFPIVCILTRRQRILAPLLLVVAVSLPWTRAALHGQEIWQEKAYLPGMSAIATGVLGAILIAHWERPTRRTTSLLGCFGAVGMLAVIFDGVAIWRVLHDGYLLLLTLSAVALLVVFETRDGLGAWWRQPAFRGVRSWGRLSYEIYLTHMFVVYALVHVSKFISGEPHPGLWCYVVALPCSWALGHAVERWFSTPCEHWLRRVESSIVPVRSASELR
jgi:peptidoglycan/LPS O-acetylase OafA/YrhL